MQTVRVRTTQNVVIEFTPASIGDRILAHLIDRIILFIYSIALFALLLQADINNTWVWIFLIGFPWLFYTIAFEVFMNGQTPGKRLMNIQVVKLDGTSPTVGGYFLRWTFCLVDIYVMSGVVAVVCIAVGGKGQRIGDIVAGTTVVKGTSRQEITGKDIFVASTDNETVTFAQAADLSDRDIELVHRALDVLRENGNAAPVAAIAAKIKARLSIQSDKSDVDFLQTIVKDHGAVMSGRV